MKDKNKTIEDKDRAKLEDYFKTGGLSLIRIPEREQMTPDYSVSINEEIVAYCELKSIVKDDWSDGGRADPVYNRIQDKIHTGMKQLNSINSEHAYPNIIAIVNHDKLCDGRDLYTVLKGTFLSEDGEIPFDTRYLHRLIEKGDMAKTDIVLWFDDEEVSPQGIFINHGSSMKEEARCIVDKLRDSC